MLSIITLTLVWITLPLFIGFSIYLFPKIDRLLAVSVSIASIGYGLGQVLYPTTVSLQLFDSFGVTLLINSLSGYFVLTNAVVTAAVIIYCWQQNKGAFFYTQVIILHGSVNAVFICADLISLYVALEVIGIAAFLLITYPRTNRAIWVGLRYLFISNTAMLFYMIGALLVYQVNQSFAFSALDNAPPEAIALIFLGLLTKGGVFVSGLWLPLTHAESAVPVSALLSGAVVTTGVFPLVRFALLNPAIEPIIQILGIATAGLGTVCAVFEKDTKRLLACSTISQMGFVLVVPITAGFYALAHGLAKAALFLSVGNLPSRNLDVLKERAMSFPLWLAIAAGSLSLAGFPLLAGFDAKVLSLKQLSGPWALAMDIAAVGTAAALAKLIFLPVANPLAELALTSEDSRENSAAPTGPDSPELSAIAIALLLSGLVAASALHTEDYTALTLTKALGKIGIGWFAYYVFFRRATFSLPRAPETLENLIGTMSIVLTVLFWIVLA
ncbi:MAG: cation:proton antiporter [Cyanobacteria bacterium P01_A01_bin.116]